MKTTLLTLIGVLGISALSFAQTVNIRNVSGCQIEYVFSLYTSNNGSCTGTPTQVSNNVLNSCNTFVYNLSSYGEDYIFEYREAGSSGAWAEVSKCDVLNVCNPGVSLCGAVNSDKRVFPDGYMIFYGNTCSANDCY